MNKNYKSLADEFEKLQKEDQRTPEMIFVKDLAAAFCYADIPTLLQATILSNAVVSLSEYDSDDSECRRLVAAIAGYYKVAFKALREQLGYEIALAVMMKAALKIRL